MAGTEADARAAAAAGMPYEVAKDLFGYTITSTNAAGATPTQAEFNALRADLLKLFDILEGKV